MSTSTTVYTGLAERLRGAILSGDYAPGTLLGSEHELARRESMSRMTVRRASSLLIAEGLLERRPGKGLYVRSHILTQPAGPATPQPIQVVAGNLTWEPCLQVSRGVQAAAKEKGITVTLYDAHGDADLDLDVVRNLPDTLSAGAVIVALHGNAFAEAVYSLKLRNYPFVLVDQKLSDINVPSVTADNYNGGRLAAQHFLDRGHTRLAFVGDLIASTVVDRLSGYRDAINDAGLPFDRSLITNIDAEGDRLGDWSAQVESSIRDLMKRPKPPTALFCSCDAIARSAYKALASLSLSIPNDVSLIGFDNDPLAEWLTPGLTSIAQPFHEMGRSAMDMLSKRITDPTSSPDHKSLPVSLIERASVGPAPKHISHR